MDDIVVYAESLMGHTIKMKNLLGRLKTAGLTLQPDKCLFLRKEVVYLGHVICEEGVRPDPQKIQAVFAFPQPKTQKNVKQFLGLAGYYRRFIKDFAKIARPLNNLLQKGVPFIWGEAQERAFKTLREILCTAPLLQYPDFNKPFIVTTDASDYALGAVLSQGEIGKDLPVAYASRAMIGAELNYSTTEKELLAMVYAVKHFRPYLYGRKFYLVTDHRPLVWLHNLKGPISRLARWRVLLSDYDYEIVHKPGRVNANADALSRNPVLAMGTVSWDSDDKTDNKTDNMDELQIETLVGSLFTISSTPCPTRNVGMMEGESGSLVSRTGMCAAQRVKVMREKDGMLALPEPGIYLANENSRVPQTGMCAAQGVKVMREKDVPLALPEPGIYLANENSRVPQTGMCAA